jgi:hypothetical protein
MQPGKEAVDDPPCCDLDPTERRDGCGVEQIGARCACRIH